MGHDLRHLQLPAQITENMFYHGLMMIKAASNPVVPGPEPMADIFTIG